MAALHIGGYEWLDWSFRPDVILLCLLLGGAYYFAVTQLRPRSADAGPVKRSQVVYYSLGVLTIYAAAGSPLHNLADEYLASAHMLQHVLLTLVAAPLLLAGTPAWVWQALLRVRGVLPVARVLTSGLMALAVFNAVMLLVHLPSAVDLQLREWWFHLFAHTSLLVAGLVMWWPVLSTVPELPRLAYPVQMGYLFLQSLVPAVMASFITFSDRAVYQAYVEAPRIWGISPLADQQIAGGIMKLMGTIILWSFVTVAFFKWYEREEGEARGPRWQEAKE
ncbi:MAG: cytochrome c oxidase assembly protein [Chloroflexi bacterium]|nr:cytochrome c oxidase assembly protein [Chloroflexota bacterium]